MIRICYSIGKELQKRRRCGMKYSKQLIGEIVKNINPELVEFFDVKKDPLKFPAADIKGAVETAMETYFKGEMNREELMSIMSVVRESRQKKKQRWYSSCISDIEKMSADDPSHPFAHMISMAKNMSPKDYRDYFGQKTIEDIINEEKKKVDAWKKNKDSYLVNFPAINQFKPGNIYRSLLTDLCLDIWGYIFKNLNGNIGAYLRSLPQDVVGSPIFGSSEYEMELQEENDGEKSLLKNSVLDGEGNELMTLVIPQDLENSPPYKTMDLKDQRILTIFLSRIKNSFYHDRKITIPFNELIKNYTGRTNYSVEQQEELKKRLARFINYQYDIKKENKTIHFNFFDNVVITEGENGGGMVTCTFGELLHDSIVEQKLISVKSMQMYSLKNKLSEVILFALQKERVSAYQSGNLEGVVSYPSILQAARFSTTNQKKNIKEISTALNEFVTKNIIIESYKLEGDCFYLKFYPMSPDELADLNLESGLTSIEMNNIID